MEMIKTIYLVVLIICYVGCIGFIVYLYFNYSRPYKNIYLEKYYTSIPENLNPIELSYLLYRKIRPEVFTATLYHLIQLNKIKVETTDGKIYFVRNSDNNKKISKSQKCAMDIIINTIGDRERTSLDDIKKFCDNNSGASDFLLNYNIWKKIATKECDMENFYVQKRGYMLIKIYRNVSIILFILNIALKINNVLGYFIIIPAIFLFLYFSKIYKRTEKYNEQYYQWIAFGCYLQDLNEFPYDLSDKNRYLIYSLLLGKLKYIEHVIGSVDFLDDLNEAVKKCVTKSYFKGNRSLRG